MGSAFDGAGRWQASRGANLRMNVWAIRFLLDQHRRLRDRALFDLAIDSKLRGCDVVKMKIGDLKTGGPVQFESLTDARASLLAWLERRGGTLEEYVFPSRVNRTDHLSTRQYARLADEWVSGVGLRLKGIWHSFASSDKGVNHIQGHRWQSGKHLRHYGDFKLARLCASAARQRLQQPRVQLVVKSMLWDLGMPDRYVFPKNRMALRGYAQSN
eukprot:gene12514-12602_t